MKTLFKLFTYFLFLVGLSLTGYAQDHTKKHGQEHAEHTFITKDKLKWGEGPAGLPAGAKLAVLSGDPTKEGLFTVRLQFPANYKIGPHWHPTAEHVTVLQGTLYMGMEEKINTENATMLQAGGFALMPPKMVHYAFTKEQTIIQIHGTGPFQITYINKADDPRNKQKTR